VRRAASLESAIAQRRGLCSERFLQMRVSYGLRASITSLSFVYSVWKINRDSLTEDCPPPHPWWIKFQNRIASL
jgi:hypothetical protein